MSLELPITLPSPQRLSVISEKNLKEAEEYVLCATSVKHFLSNHMWLQNENTGKTIRWEPWAYLVDLLDILQTYSDVTIDKARQVSGTWTILGYAVWRANFKENVKVLALSQGQTESDEMVSRCRFIWEHLPSYLQYPIFRDRLSWLAFNGSYSEIRAFPSTEQAGTGFTASLVIRDELYRHPYGAKNFVAVSPTTDAGGQLVDLSAVYEDNLSNHFVERVRQIYEHPDSVKTTYPSGLMLWTNPQFPSRALVFLGWKLRPVRLEGLTLDEFYETRLKPRYKPFDLDRQYPENIEDTLRVSLTSAYFDVQALEDMGQDVCPPIKQHELDTFNGLVRIYKLPVVGRRYVLFTDPSDGVEDPFVTGVMDYVTGEVVCSATGKEKVDFVAKIHNYLVRKFNDAGNSFEYTGSVGGSFSTVVDMLEVPNQSPRRKPDGSIDVGKKGQWVSDKSKQILFGALAFAIVKRKIVCHDSEFIQQARMVTRDAEGNPVTQRHGHFDWVMMMAGLNDLTKYMPAGGYSMKTVSLR